MRTNDRTPATPAVFHARVFAARMRLGVALAGGALLLADPAVHPHPAAAALGFAILAATALLLTRGLAEDHRRREELLALGAGVLVVTLGDGRVTGLTLLWLAAVACGILARGGQVGRAAPPLVLAILASPLLLHGPSPDTAGLLAGGAALLLAARRMSLETAELLRDPLTGVLSRAAFRAQVDRVAPLAGHHRAAALLLIDLDDFAAHNRRHGHRAGDELLQAVTDALGRGLRGDDILGRVGGDEFAVFAFAADPERLAARLLDLVRLEGAGVTAGIARCPEDGEDAESLLAVAEVALRTAKREGKRRYLRYRGPRPAAAGERDGSRALVERLSRGRGLRTAVQPIVDVSAGRVHAYATLPRFEVRGGEEQVERWLETAAALDLRLPLERACLRSALALLDGLPGGTRLVADVSAAALSDDEAVTLLERSPAPADLLLVVAERELAAADAVTEAAVTRLRAAGIAFGVGDVGTGYAGLGPLAAVRPSYLRLDPALVRAVGRDPAEGMLVRALVGYARETGCRVVAGGVETASELAGIRAAGVELAQGPLLGAPRPSWGARRPTASAA